MSHPRLQNRPRRAEPYPPNYSPVDRQVRATSRQFGFDHETCDSRMTRLWRAFKEYGDFTMAYATLQPGMNYFECHGGYIAYACRFGATLVLADPVGPPERHADMIREFLRHHSRVCFCQISRSTAAILADLGWYVNEIGSDMEIDLPRYDFDGPKKTKLRQAGRKIEREGYRICELLDSEVSPGAVSTLCSSWLRTKHRQCEARFLVRPFRYDHEPAVRKFYLLAKTGEIVAMIVCDPIFRNGKVIGYSPAIKRRSETSPLGAEEALTKFAIERFQAEGLETFRLGLMPLYDIQRSEFRDAWPLRKIFQIVYQYGDRWLYSFRGHADFKRRYRGTLTKSYLATERRFGNVYYVFAMLKACRIL